MAFIVNSKFEHMIYDLEWDGRVGCLTVRVEVGLLVIIALHAEHDEEAFDMNMLAVARFYRKRPFGSRVHICGDINVDMLSILKPEPSWCHESASNKSKIDAFQQKGLRQILNIPPHVH